jgi:hypothetical protein
MLLTRATRGTGRIDMAARTESGPKSSLTLPKHHLLLKVLYRNQGKASTIILLLLDVPKVIIVNKGFLLESPARV